MNKWDLLNLACVGMDVHLVLALVGLLLARLGTVPVALLAGKSPRFACQPPGARFR